MMMMVMTMITTCLESKVCDRSESNNYNFYDNDNNYND